jgi:Protein of unknown function (DUF1579)
MKTRIVILAFLATLAALPLRADTPPVPAEKRAILDQLRGKWRVDATVFKSEWVPEQHKLTGNDTAEWKLGGRILEWRGEASDGNSTIGVFLYDTVRQSFRHWFFGSNGAANETTGEWDAASKTLTWKGDLGNGLSIAATYRFTGENSFESKVLVTGADGKAYFHLEGKAVRQ